MTHVKTSAKIAVMTQTPVSNFRIPVDIKEAAQAKADAQGVTLTSVIIKALERYVKTK